MLPPTKLAFWCFAFCVLEHTFADDQQPLHPQKSLYDLPPLLGFGTWNVKGDNISTVVSTAIETGYRHIDCATAYGNQREVGEGIKEGLRSVGLRRSDIWVTSKLWNDHHEPDMVEKALDETLADLGVGYLDLWHMHWPVASKDGKSYNDYVKTWKAMNDLTKTNKVRYIGVSNFDPEQIKELDPLPRFHQMEMHPYLHQNAWLQWHQAHGIHVTAYSPLAGTNPTYSSSRSGSDRPTPLLDNELMRSIGEARGCTPAQVALAWGISRGTSVIPKSVHAERIREDWEAVQCELEVEDYRRIENLPVKRYNNPSGGWKVKLFKGLDDA